jgi:hypothetical protein
LTSKKDLQKTIDLQKRKIEGEEASRRDAWDRVYEAFAFLDNLRVLDPSLERFRTDNDSHGNSYRVWDIEGVKAAIEFTKNRALASQYAQNETPKAAGK